MELISESFGELMRRGGVVMWPLLALSVVSVTLAIERAWFFIRTNSPRRLATVEKMASMLRRGQAEQAKTLADHDGTVYGRMLSALLDGPATEAAAQGAVETQRRSLERFLPMLSTIITAAPMLGILGTVLGIIASFEILGEQSTSTDPRAVSQGIAEALITTATGLTISLITLFPYNAYAAQVSRTLSRLEALAAAALGRTGS